MSLPWSTTGRAIYARVEEFAGLLCPLLSLLSVMYNVGSLRWSALLFLWLGSGHTVLYFYGIYPELRYRPFFKGMFAFGVGLCWPVWCAVRGTRFEGA